MKMMIWMFLLVEVDRLGFFERCEGAAWRLVHLPTLAAGVSTGSSRYESRMFENGRYKVGPNCL